MGGTMQRSPITPGSARYPDMSRSQLLYKQAQKVIPGGVNSPVRAFRAVGGTPVFIERAEGPCLFDADGQRYIDYLLSWGPMIAGHAHPRVIDAVEGRLRQGLSLDRKSTRLNSSHVA